METENQRLRIKTMSIRGYVKTQKPALWTLVKRLRVEAKKSGKPLKLHLPRRSSIRRRSAKQRERMTEYAILRARFLQRNRWCPVIRGERATEIHHIRGRAGKLLLDTRYWLAVGERGHRWIHDNPAKAQERGWLAKLGEWGKQPS